MRTEGQAAEDLLQNALIKLANRWHHVDEPEAYIRQVLYRGQISRWRLRWPHRETIAAQPPDSATHDDADAVELRVVLRHALGRLTPRQPSWTPGPAGSRSSPASSSSPGPTTGA